MRSKTKIFIIVAIGLILLAVCQPKLLPFPEIGRLLEFAQNFDSVKNPKGKSVFEVCKSVEDIDADIVTNLTLAFHRKDREYQTAVILIVLKIYRCHLENTDGIGYAISESFWGNLAPLNGAYLSVIHGISAEDKSSAYSLAWVGRNLKKEELGILSQEISKICHYFRNDFPYKEQPVPSECATLSPI